MVPAVPPSSPKYVVTFWKPMAIPQLLAANATQTMIWFLLVFSMPMDENSISLAGSMFSGTAKNSVMSITIFPSLLQNCTDKHGNGSDRL